MTDKTGLLLDLYIAAVAIIFILWWITLHRKDWNYTHGACSASLCLLLPIIPVAMLIKIGYERVKEAKK